MKIDIWSDVVCPWCYVGKRRLEAALDKFENSKDVEIRFRSFELDSQSPRYSEEPITELLARKYGSSVDKVKEQNQHLVEMAAAEGLDFRMENLRQANSFDAHRLIHAARSQGGEDLAAKLKERIMKGYFSEEAKVGHTEVLTDLAADVGMDAELVQKVLSGDDFSREVRDDISRGGELGISGVPFFLFEGKWAVSGAQSTENFLDALEQVSQKIAE